MLGLRGGNRYTDIIVPLNDGQIDYKDVLEVYVSNFLLYCITTQHTQVRQQQSQGNEIRQGLSNLRYQV